MSTTLSTLRKVSDSWPAIRQVIYSAFAAVFGALTLLGIFTDADVTKYLGHTATVLTGVGTLVYVLASLYTPNPGTKNAQAVQAPAPADPPTADLPKIPVDPFIVRGQG